jgi:hypothetical protein
MRLVWIFNKTVYRDRSHHWTVWDANAPIKSMRDCNTYHPAFRLVTVESAREDYGAFVPAKAVRP